MTDQELTDAELDEIMNVCVHCKRRMNDETDWQAYIAETVGHICPECSAKYRRRRGRKPKTIITSLVPPMIN